MVGFDQGEYTQAIAGFSPTALQGRPTTIEIQGKEVCIMDYIYHLSNASLTLRVVQFLHEYAKLPVQFVTVIHQVDGWVVRVKMLSPLTDQQAGNFSAFLNELGFAYIPGISLKMALWALETGQPIVEVMRRYQVAIVAHGCPDFEDIEAFRKQFIQGLGYCPETLA
ncbi:hypothetical protein [Candidatus Synechococcus calcipolaris]